MDILTSKVGMDGIEIEVWMILVVTALCYQIFIRWPAVKKNIPPGPIGLPIVGYSPFLSSEPHKQFKDLSDKYGNIFSLKLGSKFVVVLSDPEDIREVFNKDDWHGRPPQSSLSPPSFPTSISSVNGQYWMEQRKFIFNTLKGLGKGNEYIDELIKGEVHHLIERLKKSNGKALDINNLLTRNITNLITQLAFSQRYDYDDEVGTMLNDLLQIVIEFADQTKIHAFHPWLARVPILNRYLGLDHYPPKFKTLRNYFEDLVREHEAILDPKNPRDYIDLFLLAIQNNEKNEQGNSFTRETMFGSMFVLFAAGGETVRTSLDWTFYVIANKPEVQQKIQEEISEVIGTERGPETSDKNKMPFTVSVIMEIQRYITIIPVNVFRYTMEDTTLGKYDIPKYSWILCNLWAIHRDPKYWDRPEEFVPDRFLDESRNKVIKPKSYLPFSYGKRICPGEQLAIDEIFLYLTSVLQKFDLKLPEGMEAVENVVSISNQLKAHKTCYIPRE